MGSRLDEVSGVAQVALETVVTGSFGIYFNVAGWYRLTAGDGTSTADFLVTAGQTIPGRWKKAEAIATPGATTDLETVFLKG